MKMDILELAYDDPHVRRDFVRLANINYASFKKYMPQLIDVGMMKQIGDQYFITEKGKIYHDKFREVKEAV